MSPTYIRNIQRVILASDLANRAEFDGLSSSDPRLLEIADQWMRRSENSRMRAASQDAEQAAWAVWRHLKPELIKLIGAASINPCHDEETAGEVLSMIFKDDSPHYNTGRRGR